MARATRPPPTADASVGEDLVRWLAFPECPDCGGRTWYFGPRGGLSINLRCERCKAWFNTVFLIGIDQMIQRISGHDDPNPITTFKGGR